MRTTISDEEYWRQLAGYERTAWRFEQQPAYYVGYEREQFDRFLAGTPEPPDQVDDLRDWFAQIRQQVAEGKSIGRVRIVDEPITDYQRWMQWMDGWNRGAGETIQYLSRRGAQEAGILPAAGDTDWWLFDDERLMLMHFDGEYRRIKVELLVDEPEIAKARTLRELAIRASREESRAPA